MLFSVPRVCSVFAALVPVITAEIAAVEATVNYKNRCLAFTPEKYISNSTRTRLEYVTNGTTLSFPDNVASCSRASQLVSTNLCRIALSIPTSKRSSITFELWLPDAWDSRRYVSTGNGGIDGC
jgi:feruloyl esterase